MRTEIDTDKVLALRRFWGRVVFFLGMLAGFVPFIMLPQVLVTRAAGGVTSGLVAAVLNRLTILPASVLAFWHRRVASWWFAVDAAVLIYAMAHAFPAAWPDRGMAILRLAVALFLAGFGLFTASMRWPPLLERKKRLQKSL